MRTAIELRLLGPTVLRTNGEEVHSFLAGPKRLGLLVHLVLARPRGFRRRDTLLPLFWPDLGQRAARNALSNMLYHVRRELGEGVVVNRGAEEVGIDEGALRCDVLTFEELRDQGDLTAALEEYRGDLLDGFYVPGVAPAFHQWLDGERSRLRDQAAEAAWHLAEDARKAGVTAEATRWATRAAGFTPFSDPAQARLIRLLHRAGDRAAALAVYDGFAARLRREWGMEPSPEVEAAVEEVRVGTGPVEGAGSRVYEETMPGNAAGRPKRSIAVLPFERIGAGGETSFTDGLHGDLLTRLSTVAALQVISRTSTRRYRDSDRTVPEIAAELNVAWVLEGDVQETVDSVHLNVRLVDARTDRQAWARDYRRELTPRNLFRIQGEIARAITRSLEATLTPEERARVERSPTENLEAYRLYARGRSSLDRRTEDGIREALQHFQRALDLDPEYALAWAGVADARSLVHFYGLRLPDDAPDGLKAAERAVELGPDVGEARAATGILHAVRREGPPALRELRRAVDLAPSYAEAWIWLGWVHLCMGEPGRALPAARRAVELDPMAPAFRVYLAEVSLANRRYDEALHQALRARELQPEYGLAHYMEGLVRYHRGELDAAVPALERARTLVPPRGTPTHGEVEALLALTYRAAENLREAEEAEGRIEREVDPFPSGLVLAVAGDVDGAFDAFRAVEAWSSHDVEHVRYSFPSVLGPLREDPRYARLLEAVDRSWGKEPEPPDTGG